MLVYRKDTVLTTPVLVPLQHHFAMLMHANRDVRLMRRTAGDWRRIAAYPRPTVAAVRKPGRARRQAVFHPHRVLDESRSRAARSACGCESQRPVPVTVVIEILSVRIGFLEDATDVTVSRLRHARNPVQRVIAVIVHRHHSIAHRVVERNEMILAVDVRDLAEHLS